MIELSRVGKVFRNGMVETTALADLDLTIHAGDFVAVMGPSGCGKSTLLALLGLIERPTSGRYVLNGEDVSATPERIAAMRRRDLVGMIFQQYNLIDELTVAQNIELALRYRSLPEAERRTRVDEAMDRVAIAHRAKHYPGQLSGGQQQRAAIARAIVGQPKLILADEPTGNLDSASGTQIVDILKGLNAQGATLIMATHSQMQADQARHVVHMLDGRIVSAVAKAR
ncbi:MAG: ABC transporter ATP-binding protein [Caulobacterales bacterium]|jgi:putative ABC transport system ATP-binding protein|nr:ABC transporter ATP-binding protein [Caulobacterales bacterium]